MKKTFFKKVFLKLYMFQTLQAIEENKKKFKQIKKEFIQINWKEKV